MDEGVAPDDPRAMDAVERHRLLIDAWFYPCSREMHAQLGRMYVADARFTATYEKIRPGMAQYVCDATAANEGRPRPRRDRGRGGVTDGATASPLLIRAAVEADPPRRVPAVRIEMCPMDRAALLAPLVDAAKRDGVAVAQAGDPWSDVDVVRDEERLPGREPDDEPLVPAALGVVFQDPHDCALALDLQIASVILERLRQDGVAGRDLRTLVPRATAGDDSDHCEEKQDQE